jgi:SMI1 / KNR4 family (SUKH-1)
VTEEFDKFLRECLSRGTQVFVPDGGPVGPSEIAAAESQLGLSLPASYRHFLSRCGAGMWCGEWVAHPSELYAFDADCLQMEGFVPLVHTKTVKQLLAAAAAVVLVGAAGCARRKGSEELAARLLRASQIHAVRRE